MKYANISYYNAIYKYTYHKLPHTEKFKKHIKVGTSNMWRGKIIRFLLVTSLRGTR